MKYLLYSDNHFSQYSSIVRGRGNKYSLRLENQLKTMNWLQELAWNNHCDFVVCLGDFFDKPDLNVEELSALKDIKWCNLPQVFIVGNHEMGLNDLSFNSTSVFNLIPNSLILDKPAILNSELVVLPYQLESTRKSLSEYLEPFREYNPKVILSHNDIKGIQMGQFISQTGFSIDEIRENCKLFINGHIHNEMNNLEGIINIGNITGQNFNEDADRYEHHAFILDTGDNTFEVIENPYAFNFYKLDFTNKCDVNKQLKQNAVVSVKIKPEDKEKVTTWLKNNDVVASRIILDLTLNEVEVSSDDVLSVDHIQRFREFIIDKLGSTEQVLSELEEVTK